MKGISLVAILAVVVVAGVVSAGPVIQDFQLTPTPVVVKATEEKAEVKTSKEYVETASKQELRRGLWAAVREARKKGDISLRDARRIRVMSFSPAFLENVEDLAIAQIASSGIESESVPIDGEGRVVRASINWTNLLAFLEALLPLILKLISAFG